jgi:hypothetical protein
MQKLNLEAKPVPPTTQSVDVRRKKKPNQVFPTHAGKCDEVKPFQTELKPSLKTSRNANFFSLAFNDRESGNNRI